VGRVGFIEGLGSEALMQRRMRGMRTIADMLAAEIRDAYNVPPDDAFVDLTAIGLCGALIELMIVWLSGKLRVSRDQLIDDIAQLLAINAEGAAAVANRRRQRSRRQPLRGTPPWRQAAQQVMPFARLRRSPSTLPAGRVRSGAQTCLPAGRHLAALI
jgi:hypothetical protein